MTTTSFKNPGQYRGKSAETPPVHLCTELRTTSKFPIPSRSHEQASTQLTTKKQLTENLSEPAVKSKQNERPAPAGGKLITPRADAGLKGETE